ncbi:MAG: glycogen/starch synthase [Cytophagales bacterium]|nr:glycogen/starch synthase [Cytophagales bacterium]
MSKLRVLYISSEINPFIEITHVADYVRQLPEAMQEKGMEIRILVPRFGSINERKNRLHEVVRLSGINIAVGDEEKPLIIKVASIPSAKLQVYFIDNDDYFHRKNYFFDKDNNFFEDNDDRLIFFCKGVLETVKKLGWAPDIIHCNDWLSSLIPLFIRTHYKKEPIYKNAKTIFTVFNNHFSHKFDTKSFITKAKMSDLEDSMLSTSGNIDYLSLLKIGLTHADAIFKAEKEYSAVHDSLFDEIGARKNFEYVPALGNIEYYYNIYHELLGIDELVEG